MTENRKINCFNDIINLWDSIAAFAETIGVKINAARQMKKRDSIPAAYFQEIVIYAENNSETNPIFNQVTYEKLYELMRLQRAKRFSS